MDDYWMLVRLFFFVKINKLSWICVGLRVIMILLYFIVNYGIIFGIIKLIFNRKMWIIFIIDFKEVVNI